MGTVTLGVSIAVPEPYGSQLQVCRAGFGDTAAHGIPTHVTLLPPTEVDPAARPAVEEHLAAVATAGRAFTMRLSGTDSFRPLSPVVFVQVVEGGSACGWLQERVREAEGPLTRELTFPYHPHVTVAHGIDEAGMDRALKELADFEASWTVTGFALYEQGSDCVWRLNRHFLFADQFPRATVPQQAQQPAPVAPPATQPRTAVQSMRPAPYQRPLGPGAAPGAGAALHGT